MHIGKQIESTNNFYRFYNTFYKQLVLKNNSLNIK